MARGLAEAHIPRDDRLKYFIAKMRLDFGDNLVAEIVSRIKHGQQNSLDFELRIEVLFNQSRRIEELAESL